MFKFVRLFLLIVHIDIRTRTSIDQVINKLSTLYTIGNSGNSKPHILLF